MFDSIDEAMFLDVPTVAKWFGISKQSVYRLIRAGELKAYRFGGSFRIAKEDFEDFVYRCEVIDAEVNGGLKTRPS